MVILKEPHRPNRFIVIAQSGEELIRAHCPNAGRELILEKPFGPWQLQSTEVLSFHSVSGRYQLFSFHSLRIDGNVGSRLATGLQIPASFQFFIRTRPV